MLLKLTHPPHTTKKNNKNNKKNTSYHFWKTIAPNVWEQFFHNNQWHPKHLLMFGSMLAWLSLYISEFSQTATEAWHTGNQSTATVPVLRRPPEQFAVLQYIGWERSRICLAGPAGRAGRRALIGRLHRSVLSLHRTLIWASTVAYFRGTGEFLELRRPPAELSGLSLLCCACENSLLYDCKTHIINRGYYLETKSVPIAMVIRVEQFTHRPSETNTNWHCLVTHVRLCSRCLLSAGLIDE